MTPLLREHRPFFFKRLSSLVGVVPLGVFLCIHLWNNAKAMHGEGAYERSQGAPGGSRAVFWLESSAVLAPLAFHTVYGLFRIGRSRPNVHDYPGGRNWSYTLERATGAVMVVFLAVHLWQFPLQVLLGTLRPEDFFPTLCDRLSTTTKSGVPLAASFYLVGIGATAYHFANGIPGFCFTWGLLASRRAERAVSVVASIFGIVLFLLGADTVLYFATGSGFVGARAPARAVATLDARAKSRAGD